MTTVKLKISAKNLDSKVSYIPYSTEETSKINFMAENLMKEVTSLKKKEIKEYKKIALNFLKVAALFLPLIIPTIGMAAPLDINLTEEAVPVSTELPSEAMVSQELMRVLKWVLMVSVSIGAGQGFVFFVLATMIRTIPNRKIQNFAMEWNKAIIKGTVQLIIAVPLIFMLWKVGSMLLKGSGLFISPF